MNPTKKEYVSEVDEQLDALFEWEQSSNRSSKKDAGEDDPLKHLRITLWSIDWEITDRLMLKLNEDLNQLKDLFRDDHTIFMFLQLLGAVGKYIKKRKGRAHPESIELLRNLFSELETMLRSEEMSDQDKKHLLRKHVSQFNDLKQKLAEARAEEEEKKAKAAEEAGSDTGESDLRTVTIDDKTVRELFERMKADFRKLIRDEFASFEKQPRNRKIYK